jgi:hypothetical protein
MSETSRPQHESHSAGSHYQPGLAVVLIILVLFVGAATLMLRSPGSSKPSSVTTTTTTVPSRDVIPKTRVRVQVANGTDKTGLARLYTQRLMTLGWDALPEMNGPKVSETIVYFHTGFVWAAREIAKDIEVKASQIKPLHNLAPVSGAASDDIVVILGPDLAVK